MQIDLDLGLDDFEIPEAKKSLSDRFGVPPFSILNARTGDWQERKNRWIALGIKSDLGRTAEANASALKPLTGDTERMTNKGVSVFDPVLCELIYSWFCPPSGSVIDPFAGGSVRGVVASMMGRHYTGIDLRLEQVLANQEQANHICPDNMPTWITGDSRDILSLAPSPVDFLISCPPYADLEVYSDDPHDLSTLGYDDFIGAYRSIVKGSCQLLKNDRFACFVVGEVRNKKGNYYNFVGDTISAFVDAGLNYYNEAILITMTGNLQLRAARPFESSRKLGKTHQNVLVFVKGDGKKAAQACDGSFSNLVI